ncbi:MAG: hypothetical protein KHZ87_06210 [Clostridiales bacterium]|nr:hypothetical protein [Clostridiales bacterium]MBS5877428.1 hypothetical protein [Clostridiales bacterium]MDU0938815.1 hypothetical protein [Clostridiales bacterium]MDU1041545.1 hypothetical protein [Clostridiales bacterium]MDU3490630.1 hypothetical protein [Clostridiales bacterium]
MGRILDGFEEENGLAVARRLIDQGGLDDNTIAMLSGLSVEEIEELKRRLAEEVTEDED